MPQWTKFQVKIKGKQVFLALSAVQIVYQIYLAPAVYDVVNLGLLSIVGVALVISVMSDVGVV